MAREKRILRTDDDDGEGVPVPVSRVGPGRFRFETLIGLICLSESVIPYDAGMGWIVEADELEDGSLDVKRVVADPSVDTLGGRGLPWGFSGSTEFKEYGDRIVALGGNWEVFAHGFFSAYVPNDRAEANGFDLEEGLQESIQAWKESSDGPEEPPPWIRARGTEG